MKIKRLKFSSKEYAIRMAVVIFAAIAPFLCLLYAGYQPSLSSYWNSDMQPVFIFANAMTSYYLYSMPSWRYPALGLLLLTAFSVEMYPITHNLIAIAFFLSTVSPLWKASHNRWLLWFYPPAIIALNWSMLVAEIIVIDTLCIFHGLLLNRVYKMTKDE